MISYYPEAFNINKIVKSYPELEMVDEKEEERLADVADRRRRGKGAPKKAKTKGWGGGLFLLVVQFVLMASLFLSFFFKADSRRLNKKR
jgi:Mitochondrial ribosomal subunit S27